MATTKPYIGVNVSPEVAESIEDFRFNNRFRSRAEAVEFILRAGMDALKDEYPELDLSREKKKDGVMNEREVYHRAERQEGKHISD